MSKETTTGPEATIAELAAACDDPRVWPALEKAIAAPVGLRMQFLHSVSQAAEKNAGRHPSDSGPIPERHHRS